MAVFKYKAKTKDGKIKEGVTVATSKKEAGAHLRSEGLSPLFVKEISTPRKFSLFPSQKVTLIEKADICRYLATMIKSGLPLMEAIDVLCSEPSSPAMERILNDARSSVQKGQPFSSVFSKYPDVFDEIFLTMVRAGEESGTLEKSFKYLGKQLYAEYELKQKIKSTLAYPAVVILATLALGMAMLVFVVPRISPVLLRLSQDFPLPPHTIFILKVGLFLSRHLLIFLGGLFGILVLLIAFSQSRSGKRMLGMVFSRLPVISKLTLALALARFCRTLSVLLKSGVSIITALQVSSGALNLPKYQKAKKLFATEVKKGTSLAEIFKKSNLFPPMMARMVSTGEKTGTLDELLLDLATFYEEEISNSLKALTSIIEPILMLGIGVGVGIIVVSVIAPIYSFVGSLSQSIGAP